MSLRRGISGHRPRAGRPPVASISWPELLEQVAGVVGAGPGLGVVLHAEGRGVPAAEPLDHPVVEVDVGDLGDRPASPSATA